MYRQPEGKEKATPFGVDRPAVKPVATGGQGDKTQVGGDRQGLAGGQGDKTQVGGDSQGLAGGQGDKTQAGGDRCPLHSIAQ